MLLGSVTPIRLLLSSCSVKKSMETIEEESIIAEFTLYFLCPGSPDEGWNDD